MVRHPHSTLNVAGQGNQGVFDPETRLPAIRINSRARTAPTSPVSLARSGSPSPAPCWPGHRERRPLERRASMGSGPPRHHAGAAGAGREAGAGRSIAADRARPSLASSRHESLTARRPHEFRGGRSDTALLLRLERAMGFEPTTSTLARLRSTPELRPHAGSRRSCYIGKAGRLGNTAVLHARRRAASAIPLIVRDPLAMLGPSERSRLGGDKVSVWACCRG
jgi:hypothetical protein